MDENPYESPETTGEKAKIESKQLFSRPTIAFLVAGAVVLLVLLFLPTVRYTPQAAYRVQCSNNLKQIALALHAYADQHGTLPPAYTIDAEGKPLHSWRTLILPYCEQQSLYEKIDLTKPWDDPANQEARETVVPGYVCPSANGSKLNTPYLAVVGEHACFLPTEGRRISEITDAHELTLMVVEVDAARAVHWMEPADLGPDWFDGLHEIDDLPHFGRVSAACVDASLYTVFDEELAPDAAQALITIDGGDDAIAKEIR